MKSLNMDTSCTTEENLTDTSSIHSLSVLGGVSLFEAVEKRKNPPAQLKPVTKRPLVQCGGCKKFFGNIKNHKCLVENSVVEDEIDSVVNGKIFFYFFFYINAYDDLHLK